MGERRSEGDTPPYNRRLTVREAAGELGISEAAVRNRISRSTLRVAREGGAVYVLLESDESSVNRDESGDESELVALLREQLAAERRANEENRRIIAGLVQRIPELEAPPQSAQEAESVAESASEGADGGEGAGESTEAPGVSPDTGGDDRRPWWRRIFGG